MNLFKTEYKLARQLPKLYKDKYYHTEMLKIIENKIQLAEAEGEEMLLDASENKDFWG